jgi:uncharacterized membrane protein
VAYIIYAANKDPFFFKAAVAANLAGVVMAAITALPGFIDWAVGIPSGTPAKSHGLTHMLLNVTALLLFVINAILHTGSWTNPSGEASGIILALLGVLCTVGAGYFGWTMIQTDHVGVELTPEQERLDQGVRAV